MPDEEMEMTVDFGQAGFVEDIDIDLDFPAGQPDEDMDLGDFDRVHDIHNFNSDTRDELMAEGDDSSYAMIDAIETDHNISAMAANDIDIELEHTVESIWQQNSSHSAGFNLDAEIDYLDETIAENMDAERNDLETSEWQPAVTNSQGGDTMDHANEVSGETFAAVQEHQQQLLPEDAVTSLEGTSELIEASHADAETAYSLADPGLKEKSQPSDVDDLPGDEITEVVAQASDQLLVEEQDEHDIPQSTAAADVQSHSPNSNFQESNEQREDTHSDEVAQTGSGQANETIVSDGLEQPEHLDVTEPANVNEDHADPSSLEEADESADDSSEYQLGGESYTETANDRTSADGAALQAESCAVGHSDSPPAETDPVRDFEGYQDEVASVPGVKTPITEVSDRDNPIELAEYYGIYISYGETDYRLFARSDDDDPNQYFLTDKSALETSLAQFLTSLREVISEEISPLDDLVLQVDGLGLEFSESTTQDFLEKFTFGDLVILYDKLVKNEQAESSPIYTYLTVKPNCNRRMMALGESANAGRGLSEVALYHDSSSLDGEQVNDAGSPDTDISTGNYNDGESGSIYALEDYEEDGTLNDDQQQNSPPVTTEEPLEHIADQNEETDEPNNNDEEHSIDGSADADDHEQGISTSKQGIYPFIFHYTFSCTQDSTCSCDDCYELELQHLATPTQAEVWPTPGIVMPTNKPTHMIWMTNHAITEDDATSESSALLLQEASDHEQQPNPKTLNVGEANLQTPKIATSNPSVDITNSENTSVTATLDGEEHDEIDYNSDEDGESDHDGIDGSDTQKQPSVAATESNVVVDDEITWESDDEEEVKHETKGGLTADTVQVSPVSGKRSRSDSDALDGAGDKSGMTSTHIF
ncbi:hypothetical protein GGR51DRAFT_554605 [Nemania sp. FL0031]|nr:hypothetical protein GGR51DRAFT_554605 [Nemania sp. FL0031]